MHPRSAPIVPLAPQRPLDLRGQLQQQAVIGLAGLGLNAKRQAVLLRGHGQGDAGNAAQVRQRGVGKVAPEVFKPVIDRGVVAQSQVFGGAQQGRGQRGDGGEDDVPAFKKRAKAARGGVEHSLHLGALSVAGLQAFFPDFDVDRLHQISRRARQPQRLEQVGDGLRKVADVAGGLRSKGGFHVHCGQGPFDVVAQALQKTPGFFKLSHKVGHGAVMPPFVRQRNAQPARVALDELAVGLGGGPIRHEFPRRAAPAVVHKGGGVAHGAALTALGGDKACNVGRVGRDREHAARGFQADVAVEACRDADRAATVGGVRQRQNACGHSRCGAGG